MQFDGASIDNLVSRVRNASPAECEILVKVLGKARGKAIAALESAALRADSQGDWRQKARLAVLALQLGAPSLAKAMCQAGPDPAQRVGRYGSGMRNCPTFDGRKHLRREGNGMSTAPA